MTNNTRMITCSALRAEYEALQVEESELDPSVASKVAVRLAFLNPSDKTDINLAVHYSLQGKPAIVLAVLPATHSMSDIFTIRGEARDKRVIEFIHNHLRKQDIRYEVSRLEKSHC